MNFNSIKQTIIALIIGSLLILIGAFFKVMHYQFANGFLILGLLFEGVSLANIIRIELKKKD